MKLTQGYIEALDWMAQHHPLAEIDIQHVSDPAGMGWMQAAVLSTDDLRYVVAPNGNVYEAKGEYAEETGARCALDIPNKAGVWEPGKQVR